MMGLRICAFLCGVAAFQHPQTRGYARRNVIVQNGDALVECALVPGAAAKVEGWLDGWSASPLSDPQVPVTVDASTPTIRVRYVAMPDNGVDVAYRPAGSDSPFVAVVVERVGPPAAASIKELVRGAEARVALVRRLGCTAVQAQRHGFQAYNPLVQRAAALYDCLVFGTPQPLAAVDILSKRGPPSSRMVQMANDADTILQEAGVEIPLFW